MFSRNALLLGAAAVALALAAGPCAFAQAAAPHTAAPATGGPADQGAPVNKASVNKASVNEASGNEIVVTASKRSEKLQDVPSSITAISGAALQSIGAVDFRDYASLVPGLSQRDSGAAGLGTVIIRGLNSGNQQTTNTAAFYIDDTPFSASGFLALGSAVTPAPELADIDHIEVLEGPQGTLYGANSLGGLIRIVTRKPSLTTYSGSMTAEYDTVDGGGDGGLIRGTVNLPIITDQLGASITGYYRHAPGFTDNVGTGTKDVNDADMGGGRIALRWRPIDRLTVDFSGLYQATHSNGYAYEDLQPGSFAPVYGPYKYNSFLDLGSTVHYDLFDLNAAYKTDLGTATFLISQGDYHVKYAIDATSPYVAGARGYVNALAGGTVFGQSINTVLPANSYAVGQYSPNVDKTTTEARFTSRRFGAVEFMAGVFYTAEQSRYLADIYGFSGTTKQPLPGRDTDILITTTGSKFEEIAGYGDVTIYLTDRLDITGGIRYAEEHQHDYTGGLGGITYYFPRTPTDLRFTDDPVNYLATLRFRLTPDISTYLRYATGFRPGGPQTNPAPPAGAQTQIQPDTTTNYEGGVKGTLWKGRLSFDASVYHIDWDNIQLNTLYNGIILQGNAGQAEVDGVELQGQYRPLTGLTIGADLGWTDARITQISAATTATVGAHEGDDLPFTPRYTAGLTADYVWPLTARMDASVGGTLRYSSKSPSNFPALEAPGERYLPSLTTVDLRASVHTGRYTVQFRIENLGDQHGFTTLGTTLTSPRPEGTGGEATVIRPRMFALSLTAAF